MSDIWLRLQDWAGAHVPNFVRIVLIPALAWLLSRLARRLIRRLERLADDGDPATQNEAERRAATLGRVLRQVSAIFVWGTAAMLVLSELGVSIGPILAAAGIMGLAVGFGAQTLVKDVISGFFILLENQYRKGDVVTIAGASGVVEDINLRRTLLRDLDGIVHTVPNGEISVSSNFTKSYSRVNLNISVGYNEDLDRAIAVINRVGKELAEDPAWSAQILKPPQVLRVDNLGDSGIDIKVVGDTKPIQQWAIMGELRLRIKKAFDQEGIEIPWPHTKVYFGNALDISALQNPKKS